MPNNKANIRTFLLDNVLHKNPNLTLTRIIVNIIMIKGQKETMKMLVIMQYFVKFLAQGIYKLSKGAGSGGAGCPPARGGARGGRGCPSTMKKRRHKHTYISLNLRKKKKEN